jgi:hypothetical protein
MSHLSNTVRNLFPRRGPRQAEPVQKLQRALAEADNNPRSGLDQVHGALEAVLQGRLWEAQDLEKFVSFTEFAIAPAPLGLGATTLPALKLLRHLLLERAQYAIWVDLMERSMHKRGRPAKKLASGAVFGVYPYPRTRSSRDHMLLTLKRQHTAIFASLCGSKGSIRQAAITAGIITLRREHGLRYNVYDAEAAKRLRETAKPKLLKEVFAHLGLDAQCTFLKGLEGVLGRDLARTWREHNKCL